MWWGRRFKRTTIILCGLLAFLGGLGLARTRPVNTAFVWVSLLLLIIVLRKKNLLLFVAAIICGLTLGWQRGTTFLPKLEAYQGLRGQQIMIVGQADTDAVYDKNSQLTFDLNKLELREPEKEKLIGKITISGFGTNAVYKGDMLKVSGKLFPTRGSRQARISFAQISVLNRSASPIERLRRKFVAGIQSALPEPQASFGLGLLVGQRNTLPKDVSDELAAVGLTHLIAVSGYNLTIITSFTRRALSKRSKYQTLMGSLLLIGSFLLFTGFSASIVRAAIVSVLSLAAWYYGRTIKPLLLLATAAAITAGWYPFYIWSDIGWYLSFLAFYGVLILAPAFTRRVRRKKKEPPLLIATGIESAAAQLMTMPLIMYIFGEVSLVALLANILVVPLVPFAMLFALVAGLAGMITPVIAGWLAWPAQFVLTYILSIVSLLARVPHALIQRSLTLIDMLSIYGLLACTTVILIHKTRGSDIIMQEEKE